jgi:hypothetical protein
MAFPFPGLHVRQSKIEGALPDVTFPTKQDFLAGGPRPRPLNLRSILSSARLFPGDLVNHRSQAIDIRDDQGAALLLDDAEP